MTEPEREPGDDHRIDLPGGRLYLTSTGAGETTALLVHGLGDDHGVFPAAVVADLARDHRVIAPDLLGFGLSRAAPGFDFSIEGQVTALEAVLDSLPAPGPLLLIGHSMGGGVATLLAARRPECVAALVSAEGNLGPDDAFISAHAVRAAERGRFDHWWRLFPAAVERQNGRTPAILRYLRALGRTSADAFLASCRSLHERTVAGAFAAAYRTLPAPRLFCHGDGTSAETLAFLAQHRLPTHHFPGAPHWLIEHDPGAFIAAIRAFR